MRKSILVPLLLLLGCSNGSKELMSNFETDFPKAEELVQVSQSQIGELYSPNNFILKDSLLFVLEQVQDFSVRCINMNTQEELARINTGRANNELVNALTLSLYGDDSLSVFEAGRGIKTFNIKDMISQSSFTASIINNNMSYSLLRIDDDKLFFSGQADSSLNNYFIAKGDELEAFGKENTELLNIDKSIDISPYLLFAREIKGSKERDKVITATRMGLLFEVIDIKKKCIDVHKYYEKIDFKMDENGLVINKTYSMMNVFCNDDNIFIILAKEETPYDSDSVEAKRSYSMITFDWELNPLKRYNINTPSNSIFYVLPDGKTLVTISTKDEENGYQLTKYSF